MTEHQDYRMREHTTNYLKQQAEALSQLEAIFNEAESDKLKNELVKIQHLQINLQNRFTRLMYLSGEAY
jgi:hypothetical protein